MQADDFIKLVDNPEFISGIYNYCDRWCEKCNYVSRCTVGTMDQLMRFGRNPDEPISTEEMTNLFEIATGNSIDKENVHHITIDLDELMSDEEEISLLNNLEQSEEEADYMLSMKEAQEFVEQHDLSHTVHQYTLNCMRWKKRMSHYFFIDVSKSPVEYQYIGKNPVQSEEQKVAIQDAFSVIDWYAMMFEVKLKRALHGYYTDKDDYGPDDYQSDFNGSAKVVVIGIERCITAFQTLATFFVEDKNTLIHFIELLTTVKEKTEMQFPGLYKFMRPAFDSES